MFIVNKFVKMDDRGSTYMIPRNYYKKVDRKAKGKLWVLTRPVKRYGGYSEDGLLEYDEENGEFPIGTVFYNGYPVEKTDNPDFCNKYDAHAYEEMPEEEKEIYDALIGQSDKDVCNILNGIKKR